MQKQKRVIAVHDLSCAGRCSATVALPILSCAGLETSLLPTALLSTHTAFPGVQFHDLTETILPTVRQWHELGFEADAVYIGYLGSLEQTELLREALPYMAGEQTRIYIDPVMGDGGKLYSGIDPAFPEKMRAFCGLGSVILPNITEACLLCGVPYHEGPHEERWIDELLERLRDLGQEQTILTGVMPDEEHIGAAMMDCRTGKVEKVVLPRVPASVCGTGDVFASALIGAQLSGVHTLEAVRIAENFVSDCIRRSLAEERDLRRGVNFEAGLGDYIAALKSARQ